MAESLIDKVWLPRNPEEYPYHWIVGEVLEFRTEEKTVKVELNAHLRKSEDEDCDTEPPSSDIRIVPLEKTRTYVEYHAEDWPDLLNMGDLHDAALLELFRRRFRSKQIYTTAGQILISINPYENIDQFTPDNPPPLETPHVFNLAKHVLDRLAESLKGDSQSILVNGESGAGKTEACKSIVKYLAHLSRKQKLIEKEEASEHMNGYFKNMGIASSSKPKNPVLLGGRGRGRGKKKIQNSSISLTGRGAPPQVEIERDNSETSLTTTESATSKLDQKNSPTSQQNNVENLIIKTNPLLEAFGNAVTIRNNNSSRFGKFIQLFYDKKNGPIVGAQTQHFLLEKSRILHHAVGERNYHVFYQLLAALKVGVVDCDTENGEDLLPSIDPSFYRILQPQVAKHAKEEPDEEDSAGDVQKAVDHHDLQNFVETSDAMTAIGIEEEEQAQLWKILAAILMLGNVKLKKGTSAKGNMEGSRVSKKSMKLLSQAVSLLGIDLGAFTENLCNRTIVIPNSGTTKVPLSASQARESLDGLIKALYTNVFDWLIHRVNKSSAVDSSPGTPSPKKKLFIGILDIFGFEVMESNSFEQLCINYANETLQQLFDECVFTWEQEEYEKESIDHSMLTYQDNSELIKIFTSPEIGVFPLLNQQCMVGSRDGADESFLTKLRDGHLKLKPRSPFFSIAKHSSKSSKKDSHAFIVHHFVSDVRYDVAGCTQKNIDALQQDLVDLFLNTTESNNPLVLEVITTSIECRKNALSLKDATDDMQEESKKAKRKLAQLSTVATRFMGQIKLLQDLLRVTKLNFVRCIKPNSQKAPKEWEPKLILNQLVFLGVMNLVRIRNEGYPIRRDFADVISRYPEIARDAGVKWVRGKNDESACRTLLTSACSGTALENGFQIGNSKCFLKNSLLEKLDHVVREKRNRGAARLQYLARRRRARAQLKVKRECATKIAAFGRMVPHRCSYVRLHSCIATLQAKYRGVRIRKRYLELRSAAIVIQRCVRKSLTYKALKEYVRVHSQWSRVAAAVKIQSFARMTLMHLQVERAKYFLSRLQCIWRSYRVRRHYHKILYKREQWKSFLRPNEGIVHTSMVVKATKTNSKTFFTVVSKKKRRLIMTTGPRPRIFYVDPATMKLKGEIVWHPTKTDCVVSSETDFIVKSIPSLEKGKTTWKFTDIDGDPVTWLRSIREPPTIMDQMASMEMDSNDHDRNNMVFKQGPVMILEYGSKRSWKRLWLRLQGIELRVYADEGDEVPVTCITIDAQLYAGELQGNPKDKDVARTLEIITLIYPNGLRIRCLSPEERNEWLEMINLVVESETHNDTSTVSKEKDNSKPSEVRVRYDALINEKNTKIENLERELSKYRMQNNAKPKRQRIRQMSGGTGGTTGPV